MLGIVEAPADATIDQTTFYTDAVNRELLNVAGGGADLSNHLSRQRLQRHGAQAMGRAEAHRVSDHAGGPGQGEPDSRHPHAMVTPPALPGGGQFPGRIHHRLHRRAGADSSSSPSNCSEMAATNGMFAFPPIIDTKIDQPEVELVTGPRQGRLAGTEHGARSARISRTLVGGNFVNRFNFDGRSYKVIPQIKRVERLNPSQLEDTYVKGPNGQAGSAQHLRHA